MKKGQFLAVWRISTFVILAVASIRGAMEALIAQAPVGGAETIKGTLEKITVHGRSMDMLLNLINGSKSERSRKLTGELIVRESTAPPPSTSRSCSARPLA